MQVHLTIVDLTKHTTTSSTRDDQHQSEDDDLKLLAMLHDTLDESGTGTIWHNDHDERKYLPNNNTNNNNAHTFCNNTFQSHSHTHTQQQQQQHQQQPQPQKYIFTNFKSNSNYHPNKHEIRKQIILKSIMRFVRTNDKYTAFCSTLLKSCEFHNQYNTIRDIHNIIVNNNNHKNNNNNNTHPIVEIPKTYAGKPYIPTSIISMNCDFKHTSLSPSPLSINNHSFNISHQFPFVGCVSFRNSVLKHKSCKEDTKNENCQTTPTTNTSTITTTTPPIPTKEDTKNENGQTIPTINSSKSTSTITATPTTTSRLPTSMTIGLDIVTFQYTRYERLYKSVHEFLLPFQHSFTPWEWNRIHYFNHTHNNNNKHYIPRSEKAKVREFYLRWAIKESYTKAIGLGMGMEFSSFQTLLWKLDFDRHIVKMKQKQRKSKQTDTYSNTGTIPCYTKKKNTTTTTTNTTTTTTRKKKEKKKENEEDCIYETPDGIWEALQQYAKPFDTTSDSESHQSFRFDQPNHFLHHPSSILNNHHHDLPKKPILTLLGIVEKYIPSVPPPPSSSSSPTKRKSSLFRKSRQCCRNILHDIIDNDVVREHWIFCFVPLNPRRISTDTNSNQNENPCTNNDPNTYPTANSSQQILESDLLGCACICLGPIPCDDQQKSHKDIRADMMNEIEVNIELADLTRLIAFHKGCR